MIRLSMFWPLLYAMLRWLPPLIAAGALLAGSQHVLANSRVTVRATASLVGSGDQAGPAGPIMLSDIAQIEGVDEPMLSKIVVVQSPLAALDGTTSVTLPQIRSAMDAAGVHWGRVILSGSACTVRVAPAPVETTRPLRQPLPNTLPKNPPQPLDLSAPATMRTVVGLRLAELYGVDAQSLRVAFDPGDEEFLATAYHGERIDIQPAANPSSPRVPIKVTTYSADRVVLDRTVSAQSLVSRTVVTSSVPLDRNQAVGRETLTESVQWLAPSAKPASMEQVAGNLATRKVAAGQVIVQDDVTPPMIVKRGDTVWVHALSGPVTVKAKAKAMGAGRDGEIVSFKLEGSDRVFSARMAGPGRAVLVVEAGAEGASFGEKAGKATSKRRG